MLYAGITWCVVGMIVIKFYRYNLSSCQCLERTKERCIVNCYRIIWTSSYRFFGGLSSAKLLTLLSRGQSWKGLAMKFFFKRIIQVNWITKGIETTIELLICKRIVQDSNPSFSRTCKLCWGRKIKSLVYRSWKWSNTGSVTELFLGDFFQHPWPWFQCSNNYSLVAATAQNSSEDYIKIMGLATLPSSSFKRFYT